MDVITDHNTLTKMFDDARNELIEVENNYRILHPRVERNDSRFYIHKQSESNLSESSEESMYEEEVQRKKVYLKSAVVAKRNYPSRKDAISKQNLNHKVQTRNCRILGVLQSTLQKFRDDAVKRQPQDMKRKRLEEKVEEAEEEEKRRLKKNNEELLLKMKEKNLQLNCLKDMMVLTESFESRKCNAEHLLNFIKTKAEPHLFYLPLYHTPDSEKELERSITEVQKNIQRREEAVMMELAKIKDSYHMPVGWNIVS